MRSYNPIHYFSISSGFYRLIHQRNKDIVNLLDNLKVKFVRILFKSNREILQRLLIRKQMAVEGQMGIVDSLCKVFDTFTIVITF